MQNDRDDKYEGSDDSEYQFSDDEGHDAPDAEPAAKSESDDGGHGGILETVTRSKRMIFSFIAFIVLIAVVYKMVSPSSSTLPATNIKQQAAAPITASPPSAPAAPVIAQPAAPPPQPTGSPATQAMQGPPSQPQATAPASQLNQQMQPSQQMPQQAVPVAPMTQPMSNQPAVIVENVMPSTMSAPMSVTGGVTIPSGQHIDANAAGVATETTKLIAQMDAQVAKQAAEFQSQMQTLNSRVANMEAEINQLVQTLTQQVQSAIGPGGGVAPTAAPPQAKASPPPRVPYNVQAIIPGRAWLRSNSGDTLTVAEGDEIKGVGRVAKIDPYDGVVEINVRGKTVSLSYGNGS